MSDEKTQVPKAQYGEPWKLYQNWRMEDKFGRKLHMFSCDLGDKYFQRAVAAVNACVGMADPEKVIAEMRKRLEEQGEKELQVIYDLEPDLKKEGMENFEGYFCHWNRIIGFAAGAGVSGYAQDPMELLAELVKQRDEARDKVGMLLGQWTQTPPTESGLYWLWGGGEDSGPIPVTVMYSGTTGKCFVAAGQWGWTRAQEFEELEGAWWMPCPDPPLPVE